MVARVSFLVGFVFVGVTLLYCGGAMADAAAPAQSGITIDRTPVYVDSKVVRFLEPGTTVQVGKARGQQIEITLSRNGQTLEGLIEAKNLLALDPSVPYHRAIAYQGSGDAQQALTAYSEAIATDKRNSRAYYNRALLYRDRADSSGVIADCTEAVKIDPKFAEAYLVRGNAYASQNDFESAVKDYDEAVKVRPTYALAFYDRSLVRHRWASELAQQGQEKDAEALERSAVADLKQAKTLGLPSLIAKRLENTGKPADIVSAVEAGYVKLSAQGGQGVNGVEIGLKSLIPSDQPQVFGVFPGTRFASPGAFQNMLACGGGELYPIRNTFGDYEFKINNVRAESVPAASLDAGLPAPDISDRFIGVTPANEDMQKLLVYLGLTEIFGRAEIQMYDRSAFQEGKRRGFPDDPKVFEDFKRQVRQAAVWAVAENMSASDISGRLAAISETHTRVAAKILDLAKIPNHIDIAPVELSELTPEELFKAMDGTQQGFEYLTLVTPDTLGPTLAHSLESVSAQQKETLATALKVQPADLATKSEAILALAREKTAATQKDLAGVKAFLKELSAKERKIVETTKTPIEDLTAEDSDTLRVVFQILGPEQYNLALANAFSKELSSDQKDILATAEKIRALDKTVLKDLSADEKADVDAKKANLELATLALSLVRDPMTQAIEDMIANNGDKMLQGALSRRRVVSLGDGVEATIAHFRQWTPGKARWEGVRYIDKNQRCVPWKLDNRISLVSEPLTMRPGDMRTVSVKPEEEGVSATFGGSKFSRKVTPLPKPIGRFVEVAVKFRNTNKAPASIQFCTPSSVYAGAYVKLNDGTAMTPVDFVLPGQGMSPEIAETVKGLTLISDLALSVAGSLGFELAGRQETCALFLFDVPRDADKFQLVIKGKTIELGLPIDSTAFEPLDDKMIP
jgi:tetratricopeptide (TPR) repeat protein